jgi:hypothetical protein
VFNVRGGRISVAEGWRAGPAADNPAGWEPAELGAVVPDLVARAAPNVDIWGNTGADQPERAGSNRGT